MAQELKAYNVVATADVNPEVVDSLGCTEWAGYDADEVDAVLAEKDKQIAELNAENERLKKCEIWMKQHFYCEEVIACESAKNRRLQRALWLARADTADSFSCMFRTLEDVQDFDERTYWIFGNKWKKVFSKLKCCLMKTASSWGSIWDTVAHKCRAKAEQYK